MKYTSLYPQGIGASVIGLGCMRIAGMDAWQAEEYLMNALDCGYNFFDHADIYGGGECEQVFGGALAKHPQLRDKILIQTKCSIRSGFYDCSKDHILASVDASLQRLGVEKIDILLLHRPDLLLEPEEVAAAFDILHSSGKVAAFGVSNHSAGQIQLLQKYVQQKLCIDQLQLGLAHAGLISDGATVNMHTPEPGLREYLRLQEIRIQAWSPLQHGFFDGCLLGSEKYPQLNQTLETLAETYGVTPAAVAIAWLLRLPEGVQPILGSTDPQHLREIACATELSIRAEDWYALYRAAGYALP